jgi:hypothetical protein
MAQADGTILINTEIKKDGAIDDIGSLKEAMRELTAAVKDMTTGLANAFKGTSKSSTAAKQFDDIKDSAKEAEASVQSLDEQMKKITVDRGQQNKTSSKWNRDKSQAPAMDYGNSVQEFVNDYAAGIDKAEKSTNEFKKEIGSLTKQLKDMESQGLYLGDDKYDETYLKLAKVKQALADYKKELTSPTESPKIDKTSMEGQVDALKKKLEQLSYTGKTFGNELYDSTYKALKKAEAELKVYQKELSTPEKVEIIFDESTLKGKVDSLKSQLSELGNSGKSFGDELYDSTYKALKNAELRLKEYQKELVTPAKVEVVLDESTLQGKIDSLKQQLRELGDSGKTFGDEIYDSAYIALSKAQAELKGYKKDLNTPVEVPVELNEKSFAYQIQQLKAKLAELSKQGITLGNPEYDKTYAELQKVTQAEKEYKKSLLGADDGQKKVKKSSDNMKKSLDKTSKSTNGAKKQMSMLSLLGKSLAFSFVFKALSTITESIKQGVENLSRYSTETNNTMSMLMSSMTQLKNSFATAFSPILTAAAPALSKLISLLAEANNWIGQTMAALAGKDTFVKAVAVQEDYAASLSDTQKAVKEAAKEAKKATFAFDTLIQAQKPEDEKYKGPTPDQMFKTEQVSAETKTLADNVKKTLSDLFQPIKDSWAQYGPSTIAAVQTMFGSLKRLASDVGASFMQVWKDEGYGKAITDDLLITFSNFSLTIANLADQFDKAWTEAETGTSIMRHLGDLVLVVTGFFREASESIKNWAASLDFGPLLRAFDGLLVSLVPVVQKVGGVLLWLLDNILLPIAKWAIEQALPAVLELISAGLDVLNSVLDALKPLALWLWEEFLKPLGEWTGEIIIGAIKLITEKLKDFSSWINDHKEDVRYITELIVAFFLSWKAAEFAQKTAALISNFTGIGGALLTLASRLDFVKLKFAGITLAIAALVTAAYEIYKNWDKMTPTEKTISMLLTLAGVAAMVAVALHAITGPAGAVMVGAAIAAGIVAAQIAINAGERAKTSASGSGGGGSRSFAATNSYAAYSNNVPHLATGTVVPPKAGNFLAMLGDNNKDYEVVSPLGTIKQAVLEAIGEAGGLGGGTAKADLIIDGTKFGQLVYKYNNKENDRVGVRMVTNGG